MPYIHPDNRVALTRSAPSSVGELNYAITKLCDEFIAVASYQQINAVIGVLECAKLEFYRRLAAPYEDRAMTTNGDVYRERPS